MRIHVCGTCDDIVIKIVSAGDYKVIALNNFCSVWVCYEYFLEVVVGVVFVVLSSFLQFITNIDNNISK